MQTKLITTTYCRPVLTAGGGWLRDDLIEVTADVLQDGGAGCTSELCIVWSLGTLATFAERGFTADELVGAEEAIEEAFWSSERETCRVASVRQRQGLRLETEVA